jgi:L-threonylcarbamoyladenylate synthase
VGLVVFRELPPAVSTDARLIVRVLPDDAVAYARALYRTLHDLDDAGVRAIVVQAVPEDPSWWAVADRLARGSTPIA